MWACRGMYDQKSPMRSAPCKSLKKKVCTGLVYVFKGSAGSIQIDVRSVEWGWLFQTRTGKSLGDRTQREAGRVEVGWYGQVDVVRGRLCCPLHRAPRDPSTCATLCIRFKQSCLDRFVIRVRGGVHMPWFYLAENSTDDLLISYFSVKSAIPFQVPAQFFSFKIGCKITDEKPPLFKLTFHQHTQPVPCLLPQPSICQVPASLTWFQT